MFIPEVLDAVTGLAVDFASAGVGRLIDTAQNRIGESRAPRNGFTPSQPPKDYGHLPTTQSLFNQNMDGLVVTEHKSSRRDFLYQEQGKDGSFGPARSYPKEPFAASSASKTKVPDALDLFAARSTPSQPFSPSVSRPTISTSSTSFAAAGRSTLTSPPPLSGYLGSPSTPAASSSTPFRISGQRPYKSLMEHARTMMQAGH